MFYILGVLNKGAVETDPFARRCLIEMIEKGFNAKLICEITGYKETVYKKVCDIVNANKRHKNEIVTYERTLLHILIKIRLL